LFVADFQYVNIPNENFWAGMYTNSPNEDQDKAPEVFQPFQFFIDQAPESPFEIFQIPNHLMMKAGFEAGF